MVHLKSVVVLGSALIGLSNAAALGSKEEYDSGAVHAHIMGIKMVRLTRFVLNLLILLGSMGCRNGCW